MGNKLVYLDNEGEMMWESLKDKGYNMSGWVRDMLKNELQMQDNVEFITKQLENKTDQKEALDNEIRLLKKKLDILMEHDLRKEAILRSVDPTYLVNMTKGIMKAYSLPESKSKELASIYLSMGETKPTLQEFMKEKFIIQR